MGLKENEFIDRNISSVDKMIIVLKAMNTGRPVRINGIDYKIGETLSGGFQPMMEYIITNSKKEERVSYVGYGGDINSFSTLCNYLTDEELALIAAENVLNQINKNNSK